MAILGAKYFNEGTEVETSIEETEINLVPRDFGSNMSIMEATYLTILENTVNWNNVEKAIAIGELAAFEESGEEKSYDKDVKGLEKIKNSILAVVQKIIEKILGLFERAENMVTTFIAKHSNVIDKNEKLIKLGIANVTDETLEGYDLIGIISAGTIKTVVEKAMDGIAELASSRKSAEDIDRKVNFIIKDMVKPFGTESVDPATIRSAMFKEKVNLLKTPNATYENLRMVLTKASVTIKQIKEAKADFKSKATKLISAIKKSKPESGADSDQWAKDTHVITGAVTKSMNTFSAVLGALISGVNTSVRQCYQIAQKLTIIGTKAAAESKTKETSTEESSILDGVEII